MSASGASLPRLLTLCLLFTAVPGIAGPAPGAQLFAANCSACHQADGGGAPGLAPPLRETLKSYLSSTDGRRYLSQILISGMAGPIASQGQTWNGMMPSFASLPDVDLETTLHYVLTDFNRVDSKEALLISAAQIAEARQRAPTAGETRKLRQSLKLDP